MRRLIWSPDAINDLIDIERYIAEFNPAAARRFFIRIQACAQGLVEFPEKGRPIGRGRRELTLVRPYVIRYIAVDSEVRVLSIRHSAMRPER